MIYFSQAQIDALLLEDIQGGDLPPARWVSAPNQASSSLTIARADALAVPLLPDKC